MDDNAREHTAEGPVHITCLPADALSNILRFVSGTHPSRTLRVFLGTATVCKQWRAEALLLLHDCGKSGIWFQICRELDPVATGLGDVKSYRRLYFQCNARYSGPREPPEIRLDDLQFLIEFGINRGIYAGGACIEKYAACLDGSAAARLGIQPDDDEAPEDGFFQAQAGAWFWSVPRLVESLGPWRSMDAVQQAADEYDGWLHADADPDEQADEEMERMGLDPPLYFETATVRLRAFHAPDNFPIYAPDDFPICNPQVRLRAFHAPTQRMLSLLCFNDVQSRPPGGRQEPVHQLRFKPAAVPVTPSSRVEATFGDDAREVGVSIRHDVPDEDARLELSFTRGARDANGDAPLCFFNEAIQTLRYASGWS